MGLLDTEMFYFNRKVQLFCKVFDSESFGQEQIQKGNILPEAALILSPESSILEGLLRVMSTCKTLSVQLLS